MDKSLFQARRESAGALRGFGDLKKTRLGQNHKLVIPKSSVASLQAPCGASATSKKTHLGQNKGLIIPKSSVSSLQAPCGASATSKKTRLGRNNGLMI